MDKSEMMVSVYCLAFNHEAYIRDALEGFVSQKTDFPFEVFVHDDASTDDTAQIIREYAEKYPHIIKPILQTENQYSKGVRIIRTHIMPRMTGKYFAACEGDDYWCDPGKLQAQVDFLEANPDFTACVHNTRMINMSTGTETEMFGAEAYTITPPDTIRRGSAAYHTSSLMYRRELAFDRPEFVTAVKGIGDYPQAIYLSLMGKIHYIPRVMSVYRWNTVGSWTNRMVFDAEKIIRNNQGLERMLAMADGFSEGIYHENFLRAQQLCQYKILKAKGDFRAAMRHPHYQRVSAAERRKVFFKACFPWLVKLKRNL